MSMKRTISRLTMATLLSGGLALTGLSGTALADAPFPHIPPDLFGKAAPPFPHIPPDVLGRLGQAPPATARAEQRSGSGSQ
jgi:hypothetical protein